VGSRAVRLVWPWLGAAVVMAVLVAVDARADAVTQVVLRLQGHNGGAVRAVVATADTVWMGEGIGVTEIDVDVDEPRRSRAVRHLVLGVNADVFGLHWLDDFLYVGAADGLHIVDLEADDGPAVVAHYVTPRHGAGYLVLSAKQWWPDATAPVR